eukprot:7426727-Alexandrium_andersonii.AAC.1
MNWTQRKGEDRIKCKIRAKLGKAFKYTNEHMQVQMHRCTLDSNRCRPARTSTQIVASALRVRERERP